MFQRRLKILLTIIGVGFLILAFRLFSLQVIGHDYYNLKAAQNIGFTERLPAPRGLIYDRNGRELATNRIEYEVRVWLRRLEKLNDKDSERWYHLVATSMGITPAEVRDAVMHAEERARDIAGQRKTPKQQTADLNYIRLYMPQPIFRNVSEDRVFRLEIDEFRYPLYRRRGRSYPILEIRDSTCRVYPNGPVTANLIGYMSRINQDEYERFRTRYDGDKLKAYRRHELIGRSGLERYHNRRLRGSRGQRMGVKDVRGRVQQEISVVSPRCGNNVTLTIDIRLQELLESALDTRLHALKTEGLGHNGGAAVIMDPNTGDVLACATAPRFDPNTVLKDFSDLRQDKMAPLFDRSRMGRYPLGSVFKVVVALAGLDSQVLSSSTEFNCTSSFRRGNRTWKCLSSHGRLRLGQGLERSCNCYFYQAGLAVGGQRIFDMAERFGLGMPTGLGLSEVAGFVPYPASESEIINLSIGGGRLLVTPLQAARLMCALANGGKLPTPRLSLDRPVRITDLGIDPLKVSVVRWGMHDVVMGTLGTARKSGRVPGLTYAGKTGTANLATPGLYHAWYCGFAPFKSPKIAFAAVIERTQEYGGLAAAPLIRDVLLSMRRDRELKKYLDEEPSEDNDDDSADRITP